MDLVVCEFVEGTFWCDALAMSFDPKLVLLERAQKGEARQRNALDRAAEVDPRDCGEKWLFSFKGAETLTWTVTEGRRKI